MMTSSAVIYHLYVFNSTHHSPLDERPYRSLHMSNSKARQTMCFLYPFQLTSNKVPVIISGWNSQILKKLFPYRDNAI